MLNILSRRTAVAIAIVGAAGCTVHQAATPTPAGPSTVAHLVTMTAIPDSISQDGSSQSSVVATAIGPTGQPEAGVILRMDMVVGGLLVDYGTLSGRSIVTGADGKARAIYTAPPAPPPPGGNVMTTVSIRAVPVGSDAQTASQTTVDIRLTPTGVILPPADTPTPAFQTSPSTITTQTLITFDGSASCGGPLLAGACPAASSAITAYAWNFGDGSSATGKTATHTYTAAGNLIATLTVTNARGASASTTRALSIGTSGNPTAAFKWSPQGPATGQTVVFNAAESTAAAGRTIVQYLWNFGDGGTASGSVVSNAFATNGTFNVTLTVVDDAGAKNTLSQGVTVTSGGTSSGTTTAKFTFSPSTPTAGQPVFFNASTSTASTGHALVTYGWDFGDGTAGTGVQTSHAFAVGTYTVTLTVTDDAVPPQKGSTATPVTATPAGGSGSLQSSFTFSPGSPGVLETVNFNASTSTAGTGHTIVTYRWAFGDGMTGLGVTTTHQYTAAGSYSVQLTVIDDAGTTATSSPQTITVGTPPAPTANFTFSPTFPGRFDQVVFDASSSSTAQGQTITDVAWNFGDGTAVVHCPGDPSCVVAVPPTNRVSAHTYQINQTFTVNLVVTDSAGRIGSHNTNITVVLADPNVIPTASPSTVKLADGGVVNFNSSQTTYYPGTPAVPAPTFSWSFGDGFTSPLANPSHTYTTQGAYTVTLSVTDGKNRTGVGTTTVTVTP